MQGVFVDVPIEIAKSRNESRERVVPDFVLNRMNDNLENFPPDIHEGFDSIFTFDELQKITKAEVEFEGNVLNKELKIR